jgi:hypothetical protein
MISTSTVGGNPDQVLLLYTITLLLDATTLGFWQFLLLVFVYFHTKDELCRAYGTSSLAYTLAGMIPVESLSTVFATISIPLMRFALFINT